MLVLNHKNSLLILFFLEYSVLGFGNNFLYLIIVKFYLYSNKSAVFSNIRTEPILMSFSDEWTIFAVNADVTVKCTHDVSDNQDLQII